MVYLVYFYIHKFYILKSIKLVTTSENANGMVYNNVCKIIPHKFPYLLREKERSSIIF